MGIETGKILEMDLITGNICIVEVDSNAEVKLSTEEGAGYLVDICEMFGIILGELDTDSCKFLAKEASGLGLVVYKGVLMCGNCLDLFQPVSTNVIYRHFKGNNYFVHSIDVQYSEDCTLNVMYQALYEDCKMYARNKYFFSSLLPTKLRQSTGCKYRFEKIIVPDVTKTA